MNIFLSNFFLKIVALTVSVPGQDLTSSTTSPELMQNKNTIFDLIKVINEYVWFFIFFIAMIVTIWGGIQLITSEGDPAHLKKANMTVTYGLVGIVIAVSSYFAVKLLVNIF